ncbi:MAG TPA: Fe-S cluster assembly ATPase SufC [Candidatus Azoamicus sp. OHIO2]
MTNSSLLNITDLTVSLINKKILNNLNIKINFGEVHVIMGPNGAGKSTLANVLIGNVINYNITGSINFLNMNLLNLTIEEIALAGIFLSFQHPIEIPGLTHNSFFKAFVNANRKARGLNPIDQHEFNDMLNNYSDKLKFNKEMLSRAVNSGFSGGEKKRNEILQMLLLNPKLIILDEIDSGLDIDSLKLVFNIMEEFKSITKSVLIITHYTRILDYINVDFVHILDNGRIIASGTTELAHQVEKYGYSFLTSKT